MLRIVPAVLALFSLTASLAMAQTRDEKVRDDRKKVEAEGFWVYNDLAKGMKAAAENGKPLLVALRCIPCEECVKLDEELMEQDAELRPLLDKFERVRIVATNGLDLSLFQFDYDQSFTIFLLNADGTIYGRYGTRSDRTAWEGDVSITGLAKAMSGALELHARYPEGKEALTAKRGPKPQYASPEKFPLMAGKYTSQLDYEGKVVQSCVHCHQIGDAERKIFRQQKRPIPDEILFPYPHPKILGLVLDPAERATVQEVTEGSVAEQAGIRAGDVLLTLEGQPLLSIADVQWVLHHTADEATLKADIRRGERTMEAKLSLPKGWRRWDNLSWRATTWPMRAMGTGGMSLESVPAEQRADLKLGDEDGMALRVKYMGQYGAYAAGKQAGFRQGDVIVAYDGRNDLVRESDLIAYTVQKRKSGERVTVTVVREGKRIELTLPMQE